MPSYMCYETGWEDSGTEVKLASPELSSPRFPSCSVGKLWPVQTQLKIKPYFLHLHFFCLSLSSPITLENNTKKKKNKACGQEGLKILSWPIAAPDWMPAGSPNSLKTRLQAGCEKGTVCHRGGTHAQKWL